MVLDPTKRWNGATIRNSSLFVKYLGTPVIHRDLSPQKRLRAFSDGAETSVKRLKGLSPTIPLKPKIKSPIKAAKDKLSRIKAKRNVKRLRSNMENLKVEETSNCTIPERLASG